MNQVRAYTQPESAHLLGLFAVIKGSVNLIYPKLTLSSKTTAQIFRGSKGPKFTWRIWANAYQLRN